MAEGILVFIIDLNLENLSYMSDDVEGGEEYQKYADWRNVFEAEDNSFCNTHFNRTVVGELVFYYVAVK